MGSLSAAHLGVPRSSAGANRMAAKSGMPHTMLSFSNLLDSLVCLDLFNGGLLSIIIGSLNELGEILIWVYQLWRMDFLRIC